MANTFFERHLDLHNTCHKEAADQYQIVSAQYPVLMLGMLCSCSMMAQRTRTFKRNGSKCYTSEWLLSLTTLPFIAFKKDLLPATNSLSFADNPRSTNY